MSGFYERMGCRQGASEEQIRDGHHSVLARLVKKLRSARAQGADTAVIEAQRDELREAFEVLTDPGRRRRYDLMLRLDLEGLPQDADELWDRVEGGLVDPTAAAAVEVVRAITSLDLGEPFIPKEEERTEPAPRPSAPAMPPRPKAVSLLSQEEREQRARHAVAALPQPGNLPQVSMPAPSFPSGGAVLGIVTEQPAVADPSGLLSERSLESVAVNLGYDGRYLCSAREGRGMSLEQVSDETKIAVRYLQAIESNEVDRLPAAVFVRGYLREIAAVLEIEEGALVEGYMSFYNQQRGG